MSFIDNMRKKATEKAKNEAKKIALDYADRYTPLIFGAIVLVSMFYDAQSASRKINIVYNETHVHVQNLYLGGM